MKQYQSPSGKLVSDTEVFTLPQIEVPATASMTGTFACPDAEVGMGVLVTPSTTLGVGAILSSARVSAAGVVEVTLASVSAAVTVGTQPVTVSLFPK